MNRARWIAGSFLAFLSLSPLLAPPDLRAQSGAIRGRVTDGATQQPIAGATITVGSRGTLARDDGSYFIADVPAGSQTVIARMLGYGVGRRTVNVAAGDTVVVDFALEAQAVNLSQVVVVGYGEERAGNITGAVKQVNADKFNTGTVVTPQQLIQGKVAGVQVVDNNAPGGGLAIRIRGATSINASSDPLFVIDGMPIGTGAGGGISAGNDPLNFLNPNDIESITVLKDASAASIYGANAANGVVIIKTKSGKGPPSITYSAGVSAASVTKLPEMLNAEQFRSAVEQYAPQNANQLANANTDWFGLITRTGWGQQHNITVAGEGESNDYRVSAGYMDAEGIVRNTGTKRFSLGIAYDQRLFDDRLDIRANVSGARTDDRFAPDGLLGNAAQMGPTQPVMDPTTVTGYYDWPGNTLQSPDNPVAILNLASALGTTYRSVGNARMAYSLPFIEGLKANVNLGYDVTKTTNKTFNPSTLHAQMKSGGGGFDYRSDGTQVNTILETYLDYSAPLDVVPGNVDATVGYSYSGSHGEFPSITATGLGTNLLGTSGFPSAQNLSPFLDTQESKLISFFGRVNYNLNDRYLLSFSVRHDGSSRFGKSNAWGTFPSVGAAWRISEEPFMRGITALSDLKIRASWAKTGNQAFGNYQQYSTYLLGNAQAQVQFGDQFVSTLRPSAVDPNIKWEETRSWDVGIDYGFLDQRLTGSIDYYRKNTDDLIFTVPVAAGTNLSNFLTTNIGSMKNEGVEFSLSARVLDGGEHGLGWTADFDASHNTNELTRINPFAGESQQILTGLVSGGVGTFIQVLEPGEPINSFFVYKQKYENGKPVEGEYENLGGDSTINADDRRAFHDPAPKWILGHSSYFTYGKLDLSFTLRAYLGNYVYNNIASNLGNYQELSRSSPYNLSTSVLKTGFMTPQYLSDYYVEDASFLRMDNITLGYTFAYAGRPVRASFTVQNAFTLTGYSGVDPTAGLNGLDNNIYPRSRTYTGGLSIQF